MGFKLDYRFFFLKFNKKPQDFKNDEKLCFLTLKFSHNQRRDQIEIDIVDDVYEEDNDSYDDDIHRQIIKKRETTIDRENIV